MPTFKRVIRFAATDASEFSPTLSPDGKWIAYIRDTADRCDLWVQFLTGGEAVNLTGAFPDLYVARRDVIGGIDIAPDGIGDSLFRPTRASGRRKRRST